MCLEDFSGETLQDLEVVRGRGRVCGSVREAEGREGSRRKCIIKRESFARGL